MREHRAQGCDGRRCQRRKMNEKSEINAAPIRLLLADDHHVVRTGLIGLLNGQPGLRVVAEAEDGVEAVALWREHRPDVSLLDLQMPGLDGVAATTAIRAEAADARVIVLTTYDTDEGIYAAVRAGAKAYLLKDVRPATLFDRIRQVHAGEPCLDPAVSARVAERLAAPELTKRELQVLALMAAGVTNRDIASRLFVAEVTVKTHVGSIFGKLNVTSRAEAVAIAAKRGLVRL